MYSFRPVYFVPVFSKHKGQLCAGAHLFVTDRDAFQPVNTMLHVLQTLKRSYPTNFGWRAAWVPGRKRPIDLLWGCDSLRRQIDADRPVEELISGWQPGLHDFNELRSSHLLYHRS